MNTMGEHGVCPLYVDWRDNTQEGHSEGQDKELIPAICEAAP